MTLWSRCCAILLVFGLAFPTLGADRETIEASFEVYDDRFHRFIAADSRIEILADGLGWAEGPVWVGSMQALLFSDVAANRIYRWRDGSALETYLHPSGHAPDGTDSPWRGSNGLALGPAGGLYLAQQSSRRVARMDATLQQPNPAFTVLATGFGGDSLNSPNDLVVDSGGNLYFTDPPYGLDGFENSPAIELDFFGVFRLDARGELSTLLTSLKKPNGIGLSPDESILYVSNSEPGQERIVAVKLDPDTDGQPVSSLFFDAGKLSADGPGSTDGLTVHPSGNLFVSVPNGFALLSASGEMLGKAALGQVTNLALDADAQYLYITMPQRLLRLRLAPATGHPD